MITRRTHPAKLTAILHESALRTMVGAPKVMEAQHRHLADSSTRSNIDIRVLPFRAGLPVGWSTGPFVILNFGLTSKSMPTEPTLVYTEAFTGGMYFEDSRDVDRYRDAYRTLLRAELEDRPSRDLLRETARGFKGV